MRFSNSLIHHTNMVYHRRLKIKLFLDKKVFPSSIGTKPTFPAHRTCRAKNPAAHGSCTAGPEGSLSIRRSPAPVEVNSMLATKPYRNCVASLMVSPCSSQNTPMDHLHTKRNGHSIVCKADNRNDIGDYIDRRDDIGVFISQFPFTFCLFHQRSIVFITPTRSRFLTANIVKEAAWDLLLFQVFLDTGDNCQ